MLKTCFALCAMALVASGADAAPAQAGSWGYAGGAYQGSIEIVTAVPPPTSGTTQLSLSSISKLYLGFMYGTMRYGQITMVAGTVKNFSATIDPTRMTDLSFDADFVWNWSETSYVPNPATGFSMVTKTGATPLKGVLAGLGTNNFKLFENDSLFFTTTANPSTRFFQPAPQVAAPVPEPATWATMMLGFGLLGAAVRRRRTVRA